MTDAVLPTHSKEWHQRVLMLAWPVILSNLSIPLVGAVDTAVVGQLSHPRYLAAVAIGAIIFTSTFWVFGFLRMGTTGFIAQAFGRSDEKQLVLAFARAGLLALLLGLLYILLQKPIEQLALYFMKAEPEVQALAETYYGIRVWSAPATFLNYCIVGVLIGMQKMRWVLGLQLLLNGCNIALDMLFVNAFDMDVAGVAWASLISEYFALLLGLWLLRKQIRQWKGLQWQEVMDISALKAFFDVNGNLFIRTLLLMSAFYFFTAQGASFGTVILAANAVLINMLYFLSYGLDGFAQAAEALVGSAYGRRDRKAFHMASKISSLWALILAVMMSFGYWLIGEWFIRTLTKIPEVIEHAETYLIWMILAPVIAVWSYQLDGIYIGATQTRIMRNTMFVALVIYLASAMSFMPLWGNHGLWAALLLFLLARGVAMAWYYPKLLRALVVQEKNA